MKIDNVKKFMYSPILYIAISLIVIGFALLVLIVTNESYKSSVATILAAIIAILGIWLGYHIEQQIKLQNAFTSVSIEYENYISNLNILTQNAIPLLQQAINNETKQQDNILEINTMISRLGVIYEKNNDAWTNNKHIFVKKLSKDEYKEINEFIKKVSYVQDQINLIKQSQIQQQIKKGEYVMEHVVDIARQNNLSEELTKEMFIAWTNGNNQLLKQLVESNDFVNTRDKFNTEVNRFVWIIQLDGYAYYPFYPYQELHTALQTLRNVDTKLIDKALLERNK